MSEEQTGTRRVFFLFSLTFTLVSLGNRSSHRSSLSWVQNFDAQEGFGSVARFGEEAGVVAEGWMV